MSEETIVTCDFCGGRVGRVGGIRYTGYRGEETALDYCSRECLLLWLKRSWPPLFAKVAASDGKKYEGT